MMNFTYAVTGNRFQFDVLVSNENSKRDQRRRHPTVNSACGETPGGAWGKAPIKILVEGEPIQVGTYRRGRILLDGNSITTNGSTVQLTLQGRSSGIYTVQRVSLVWWDRNTLNGIDNTHRQITSGETVTSVPILFDLLAAQNEFGKYRVPSGNPTVYRTGGTKTMAWTIWGKGHASAIDWGSLSPTKTLTYISIAESLEMLAQSGGGPPTAPPPPPSLTISNLPVAGGQWYVVPASALQVGNTVNIDRSFTFTTVPSDMQGAAYIETANQETGTLSFPSSVIPASRWRESIRWLVSGFRSKRWVPATANGYDDQGRNCIQLILSAPLPHEWEALANKIFPEGYFSYSKWKDQDIARRFTEDQSDQTKSYIKINTTESIDNFKKKRHR